MKKSYLLVFISLAMLIITSLSAEVTIPYLSEYLYSYPSTIYKGATAPFNWTKDDYLKAGGLLLTGGMLYLEDEYLRDLYQRNRIESVDDIFTVFEVLGNAKYMFPALGVMTLSGYCLKSDKTMETGLLSIKSAVLAQGLTSCLKIITQRPRPETEQGKEFWSTGSFSLHNDSFPSAHSTLVWSLAPIFAEQYKENKWVPPLSYTIAILTSCSRLNDDKHWSSDVFIGSIIGYFTAQLVLKDTPRLTFNFSPDLSGIGFCYEF